MDKTKKHFFLLNSFRGIASVWLVAFHILPSYISGSVLSLIEFGRIGTDFFFVASGYVTAIACYKHLNGNDNSNFVFKRLSSIYRLYLYSLLLALLVVPFLMAFISYLKSHELIFNFNRPNLTDLLLYLSLLKVFTSESWALNSAFVQINGVYWFIAVIVQIYLLLGLALKCKAAFYPIIFSTLLLSTLCLFDNFIYYIPIGLFLPHFIKFFFGMLLYFCLTKVNIKLYSLAHSALIALFILLLASLIYLHHNEITGHHYRVLSAFTVSLMLFLLYPLDEKFKKTYISKITTWLAEFSYSTYLNHILFWPLMYALVSNAIPLPLSLSAPLLLLPAIIICCFISHKIFNQPGLKYYLVQLRHPALMIKALFTRP